MARARIASSFYCGRLSARGVILTLAAKKSNACAVCNDGGATSPSNWMTRTTAKKCYKGGLIGVVGWFKSLGGGPGACL